MTATTFTSVQAPKARCMDCGVPLPTSKMAAQFNRDLELNDLCSVMNGERPWIGCKKPTISLSSLVGVYLAPCEGSQVSTLLDPVKDHQEY